MREGTPPSLDMPRHKESEVQEEHYAGLHARLLSAELSSLNPENQIGDATVEKIESFEERNYTPYERASKKGRKKYWKQQVEGGKVGKTRKEQYQRWEEDMIATVNQKITAKHRQDIFYPLMAQMGIEKADGSENFTREDARKLFEHYFSEDKKKDPEYRGVKQFVRDVMSTFQSGNKPDEGKIREYLPVLKGFAAIFGEEEAAMVAQLVDIEAKLANNPNAKNIPTQRANDLNDDEKRILGHITEANQPWDLPVLRHKEEIQRQALTKRRILLTADTGAGKSVGVPPLVRETLKPGEKILMTQPQRTTSKSVPYDVASLSSLRVGKEIGYITGEGSDYDKRKTDTIVATERVGLYMLLNNDEWFSKFRHILFDEAHKLTPDMEIAAALALDAQKQRDLSVWFISATADEKKFMRYAGIDKPIKVEGRTFGKDVKFSDEPIYNERDKKRVKTAKLMAAAARKTAEIVSDPNSEEGDIIIGIAGETEREELKRLVATHELENIQIVEIHSGSTKKEKAELKKPPPPGIRRIIIGTNAIETGVTIPTAKYVINTGEKYEDRFDPVTGMTYIRKTNQSQAEARQWEGRVGRTSKGYVFHLMTEEEFNQRRPQPEAPIHRSDITQYVLLLRAHGRNILDLHLPSGKLDESRVQVAEDTLRQLGALDAAGTVTDIGKRMAAIPADFHITRAIAQADKEGKGKKQLYELAAMLETTQGKSIIKDKEKVGGLIDPSSDFMTYLNIWNEFVKHGRKRGWAEKHGVEFSVLDKAAKRLVDLEKRANFDNDTDATSDELGRFIFLGYQDRLMQKDASKGTYAWQREQVKDVDIAIDRSSLLSGQEPDYVVSTSNSPISERGGDKQSRISMIQPVKAEWLQRKAVVR